ncbi:MAG: 50S ribosomal protein L4 [SAR202 cluster bacterium Io17-Chloro-G7]|nr:MAG: 50S ribosomal protein L4 [SAR202 cluster bacterium Io17-Chloro-G7]
MEITVKNQSGETLETIDLADAVYNVPMNHSLVHQALVIYQLNKRHGTHDTKTRAQVSGGGRKPWIQKHTGRARQGSIRSPQWRHGGVVFGPHPRSYRKALPQRFRRLALKCVLSDKARQDRLICLNSMDTLDGKTKSMVSLLQNLNISGSALVITKDAQEPVVRSAKNLGNIWTLPVNLLNAHELLRRETVIMTVEAARWAEEFFQREPDRKRIKIGESDSTVGTIEAPVDDEVSVEPVAQAEEEPQPEVTESPMAEAVEGEPADSEAADEEQSPELEQAGEETTQDQEEA